MRAWRRDSGASLDALVVGLGNPGGRYARTRHNVGFMVVDRLADRLDASLGSKYDGRFGEARLEDARIGLLEPGTFMNVSGRSVAKAARFYKLPPEAVIVVHDDLELPFERVRAKAGGGLKGHNGLRSLADSLGSREFLRVRCGVGRPGPGDRRDIADWLLAPFEAHEDPAAMVERAADCVETIVRDGAEQAERAFA
jgi:PTH1 family peptidyl-tRNA hydrolase